MPGIQYAGDGKTSHALYLVSSLLALGGGSMLWLWRQRKRHQQTIWAHFHLAKVGMTKSSVDLFISLLDDRIRLTHGEDVPEGVQVLISNMPKDSFYTIASLRAIILPYAGPPQSIVQKIKDSHGHLTLHNLHSNAVSTAEMGMSLCLAAAKLLVPADRLLREGDWTPGGGLALCAADINFVPMHQVILEGKKALVLGLGEVGNRIAASCQALGMEVCGIRRSTKIPHQRADGVWVYPTSSLHDLLPSITALFISMPSTPETRGLVGKEELRLLPPEAIVVNMGRGEVIDEAALYECLKTKKIHGAGLDVWWQYPHKDAKVHDKTHPSRFDFGELDNVVMSPHRGGAPGLKESEERRIRALADLLNKAIQTGGIHKLKNRVPLDRGY